MSEAYNRDTITYMNEQYRQQEQPSEHYQDALQAVCNGESLSEDTRAGLVAEIYSRVSDRQRDTSRDAGENGLLSLVTVQEDAILLHISKPLYEVQPLGVICKPLQSAWKQSGELVVRSTQQYTANTSPVMDEYTHTLYFEPLPMFIEKFTGKHGYDL